MTLSELMSGLDDEQKVKIGTEGGSGFFFAGTVKQYRQRQYGFNKELKRRLEKAADDAEKRIARAERQKGILPEADLLIASGKASLEVAKFRMETFKPLCDREVLETLTASDIADEETPLIVNIEGSEDGTYWTMAEAKKVGDPFSMNRNYRLAAGVNE